MDDDCDAVSADDTDDHAIDGNTIANTTRSFDSCNAGLLRS